jgi:heme-degrading monooxygenase HmoA
MSVTSYLRFFLASEADRDPFEDDLKEMLERAMRAPGYVTAEAGRDPWEDRKYLVVSEWETIEHLKAWEHSEHHERVMSRWPDERWAEPFRHVRLAPWRKDA